MKREDVINRIQYAADNRLYCALVAWNAISEWIEHPIEQMIIDKANIYLATEVPYNRPLYDRVEWSLQDIKDIIYRLP